MYFLENKKVLIFGGTGSLGQALIRRLIDANKVVIFSRDEAKHWTIKNRITSDNLKHEIGDIRDLKRVTESIKVHQPDYIIIASALKQVDTCENFPHESIQTNIIGVSNVIDGVSSLQDHLKNLSAVVMVSTDKACAPTNVYGMSKAIAERVVTNASQFANSCRFIGVRYGNVLQSRGSIIPLFHWQARNLPHLTLTHKDMTRYIMTLDESIDLITNACLNAQSGEIFMPKLKSMRIIDLAEIFARRFDKKIKITGIRPGEKLHEELISEPESLRVKTYKDVYILRSSLSELNGSGKAFSYRSDQGVVSRSELEDYLDTIHIFEKSVADFEGKHIEEINTSLE
jgi:UDP-N-acetylglucosamine 4,6-dehydratase/5-epimerase